MLILNNDYFQEYFILTILTLIKKKTFILLITRIFLIIYYIYL